MNNIIMPPADASPAEFQGFFEQVFRLHPNARAGAVAALRLNISHLFQQASEQRQGVDYRAGLMEGYRIIKEYLK